MKMLETVIWIKVLFVEKKVLHPKRKLHALGKSRDLVSMGMERTIIIELKFFNVIITLTIKVLWLMTTFN